MFAVKFILIQFIIFSLKLVNKIFNINKFFEHKLPATNKRIRGEYENKIRRYSAPEKIFEVFASI